MIVLRSKDLYTQFAILDPNTLQISKVTQRSNPEKLLNQKVRGTFADLDGHSIYFYRGLDDQLHLLVDQVEVGLDNNPSVKITRRFARRDKFQVFCSGKEVYALEYKRPKPKPPLWLDFTQSEEEDFNIFMFIHNVLNDGDRRNRAYRGEYLVSV